jgi:tetratricopeptide (TPR) repeat protein
MKPGRTRLLLILLLSPCLFGEASAQTSSRPTSASPHRAGTPRQASFEELSAAATKAKQENRDDEAIALYERALRLKPDWKEGLWFEGVLQFGKEKYSETRDLMRRLVAHEPKAGSAWALLGMSEYQTKDYSRALDHLQRARDLGLGEQKEMAQSVYFYTSILLTRFQRYDDSSTLLFAMVKSGSPPQTLVEPIGLAVLRYPFLPSEIPSDRRMMFQSAGQATLAVEAQRRDDAEKILSALVSSYGNEPGVHFLYGVFLLDVRPAEGVKELQEELKIAPFNFTAKVRLGEEYLKEERNDEALRLADEVLKVDPGYSSAHLIRGEALIAKGDLANGIAALEVSRKLRPDIVRTHWDLLRAYTAAGRSEDAQREKEEIERLRRPEVQ